MSNRPNLVDHFDDDFSEDAMLALESTIRSASRYVVPSDDLRPQTLESAREICNDRKTRIRLAQVVLSICLIGFLILSLMEVVIGGPERLQGPSSDAMNEQAMIIAREKGIGVHWGLMEAFSELRSLQASRLNPAASKKSSQ